MSSRIQRVNSLIKKELSRLLLKEMDLPPDLLTTVTRVETSANLIQTKIYISVMPEDQFPTILKILNSSIYRLQQKLNKRLKMRPTPKIQFVEEKRTAEAGKVEKLLDEIHREKSETNSKS